MPLKDYRAPINRIINFYEPPKVLKTFNLIKIGILWAWKTFAGMVGRCMPNSGHGGPLGTRVMTIFVFYVSAQITNID